MDVNQLILAEGQAKVAQQKALWQAQRHSLTAEWDHQLLQKQTLNQQALLEDLHLMHLPHGSPYEQSGACLVSWSAQPVRQVQCHPGLT